MGTRVVIPAQSRGQRRRTFATRLLIAAVALSLLLIGGTGAFLIISRAHQTQTAAETNADNRAQLLRQLLQKVTRPEERAAVNAVVAQPGTAEAVGKGLLSLTLQGDAVPFDASLVVISTAGTVLFTAQYPPSATGVTGTLNHVKVYGGSSQPLFVENQSAPKGLPTVRDALAGKDSEGLEMIDSVTPAYDVSGVLKTADGHVTGCVVVIAPLGLQMGRYASVVGYTTTFVSAGSTSSISRVTTTGVLVPSILPSAGSPAVPQGNSDVAHATYSAPDANGGTKDVAGSLVPLAAPGPEGKPAGYVGVEVPLADFTGPLADDERTLLEIMLSAVIFVGLACFAFVYRYVRRPVKQLQRGVERIAGGDLTQDVNVRTHDELESLSDGVNIMRGRLAGLIGHLHDSVLRLEDVSEALTTATQGVGRLQLAVVRAAAAVVPGSSVSLIQHAPDKDKWLVGVDEGELDGARLMYNKAALATILAGEPFRDDSESPALCVLPMNVLRGPQRALVIASPKPLNDHDQSVLTVIANSAAIALNNAQLFIQEKALLQQIIDASDQERERIARDLHDGVVQNLAGLAFTLASSGGGEANQVDLDSAAEEVRSAMRDLRTLIVEIAPPDLETTGLEVALRALLEPLNRKGVKTQLTISGELNLSRGRMALIHRVAQEALRNVVKHSQAHQVLVDVATNAAGVTLRVVDDGIGFSPDKLRQRRGEGHVGLGLLSGTAAEAGATLNIDSTPGKGTTVVLTTPFESAAVAAPAMPRG